MKKSQPLSAFELLKQTEEAFNNATTDQYGRLRPPSKVEYFELSVTKATLIRALKLFEIMIEFEKEGFLYKFVAIIDLENFIHVSY